GWPQRIFARLSTEKQNPLQTRGNAGSRRIRALAGPTSPKAAATSRLFSCVAEPWVDATPARFVSRVRRARHRMGEQEGCGAYRSIEGYHGRTYWGTDALTIIRRTFPNEDIHSIPCIPDSIRRGN